MNTRPQILSMPNIPKPLHGLNPRTIMGQKLWDECRREVYASTDHHCAACGVHKSDAKGPKWMEAHELFEINYKAGIATLTEIVPLCHFCHSFIHSGLLRVKARKKSVTAEHVREVLRHGIPLLREAGSGMFSGTAELCDLVSVDRSGVNVTNPPRRMAEWRYWRMNWNGQEYRGKFKSMHEWKRHYS